LNQFDGKFNHGGMFLAVIVLFNGLRSEQILHFDEFVKEKLILCFWEGCNKSFRWLSNMMNVATENAL